MADRADPPPPRRPARRRRALAWTLAGGAGVLVVAALAVWLARNAVGERLAVDYLRSRGIPATLKLTRLDAGGVAGSVVIGPAVAPTLTVERFEADFAPGTVLARRPQIRRLVLVRPRLTLRFDGRRLDFGALQPLVDEALRAPSGKGPGPDVRIEDGLARVATPYGGISLQGAGDLASGRLRRADLRLLPAALAAPAGRVEALAGTLALRAVGADALSLQGRFSAGGFISGGMSARALSLTADGLVPYRAGAADAFAGRAGLRLAGSAASIREGGAVLTAAAVRAALSGDMALAGTPLFSGDLKGEGQAAAVEAAGARLAKPTFTLALSRLSVMGAHLDARGEGALSAPSGEARAAGERMALGPMRIGASGRLNRDGGALVADGAAQVAATGGFAPPAAARLAAHWAPGPYGDDLRPALAHGLQRVTVSAPAVRLGLAGGRWRAALDRPAALAANGGGRLELAAAATASGGGGGGVSGSAGRMSLSGGGLPSVQLAAPSFSLARGLAKARFEAQAEGSAGPLREARLALAGTLASDASGVRVVAARCGDFAFARFMGDKGEPLATAAHGRACPVAGAPLATVAGGRWTLAADVQDAALTAPPAKLALSDAAADVRLQGRGGAMTGTARVRQAAIADTDTPRRFNPLAVSGVARLAREVWTADMAVVLAKGVRPLGDLRLMQDLKSGAGGLTLEAPRLVFAPDALQPAAVLPSLAALATEVSGPAAVRMDLGWKGEETSASVHVSTDGLQGKTPAGMIRGVKTDLTITSLDPLASAPDQTLTAQRLEAVTPLTDLKATYQLGKDEVVLRSASATLAQGRVTLDPMRVGLLPDSVLTGAARIDGVQLGALLDAVNLSRAVKIDARLQGVLPFSLGPAGLRLTDGHLEAMGPGRLTLQREALTGVSASGGEPTAAAAQPSAVQDFAFQALEDLAFTELTAQVGSRPQGRLGVVFHIKGRHEPAQRKEARVGLVDLLRGKAFDKPIPLPTGTEVNLTLDSSLNVDDLLAAYTGLSRAPGSAQVHP